LKLASAYTSLGDDLDRIPGRTPASFPEITDPVFWRMYAAASPFSLLHISGFYNVFQSMHHIRRNNLPGDLVECGCFLGGVGIFMALLREYLDMSDRTIWLLDTFEGFPDGQHDHFIGQDAPINSVRYDNFRSDVEDNIAHCLPEHRNLRLIEGPVEATLPTLDIRVIALLRLDTDFYTSTKAELEHLYGRLVRGGVLIVDDYGIFQGSRRATDEYLARLQAPPLLNRIDTGVWAGVKP
jgi:O-methyltransferase